MNITDQVVHTVGINWDSVITIIASVVVIMTTVFGILSRYIANRVTGSINQFRIDVITKMEERITSLESLTSTLGKAMSDKRRPW